MAVRIKLDEDLSPLVGEPFRKAGYSVITVFEQGWSGLKDAEVWSRAVSEGVFWVTADKGFGDIRVYPPGTHPGILVLRPGRESILDFQSLVASVAEKHMMESLAGSITVASPRSIRVRRKPPAV
jgi:predicted nuclease of predicted toxin-antitoxin system